MIVYAPTEEHMAYLYGFWTVDNHIPIPSTTPVRQNYDHQTLSSYLAKS